METDQDDLLAEYLTSQGCSWQEIERVREKVRAYEARTVRESVFDSIAAGSFNLKAMIREARDDVHA